MIVATKKIIWKTNLELQLRAKGRVLNVSKRRQSSSALLKCNNTNTQTRERASASFVERNRSMAYHRISRNSPKWNSDIIARRPVTSSHAGCRIGKTQCAGDTWQTLTLDNFKHAFSVWYTDDVFGRTKGGNMRRNHCAFDHKTGQRLFSTKAGPKNEQKINKAGPKNERKINKDERSCYENREDNLIRRKETKNSTETKIIECSPKQMDKDFEAYLTGNIESKHDDPSMHSSRASVFDTSIQKSALSSSVNDTHQDIKPTNTPPENDSLNQVAGDNEWLNHLHIHHQPRTSFQKEYRHIEQKQRIQLKKTYIRQSMTVRRALTGNLIITLLKLAAALHSGSSAMTSEFIHSLVDSGNQCFLLMGLRDSENEADRAHPYGYGKSIYFWALVSALGSFFLGAGISMTQSIPSLFNEPSLHEITWHVWAVLAISFAVDGYVFTKTIQDVIEGMPIGFKGGLWRRIREIRDPATLAILLEDGAACVGILIAASGIILTHVTDMPVFDALAGVGISGLLMAMGCVLARVNHRFLLGQAVDQDMIKGIEQVLLKRRSVDHVHSVQSQWTGPETFSYKAEVDFDGTFLAAKLMPRYQKEFAQVQATLHQDLRVLLSWYAEDVMRTVENEVRHIEAEIREAYPGAQYIELEPMSKDADRFAIDDGMEAQLKRIEIEALNRYLKSLYQKGNILKSKSNTRKSPGEEKQGKGTNT